MRVLVVEDERRLAENVAAALREGPGYAVDLAADGQAAMHLLKTTEYDLLLLDLMLPRLSGQMLLRWLRSTDQLTPVLILTAVSGAQSAIELLNAGADDYLTKPFDLGELLARSRALVRRGKGVQSTVLRLGTLTLDTTRQSVSVGGGEIELSPTEYRILDYLMHRPRMVISKRQLLEHMYDFTWEHHSNVIEVHISNLRRKVRAASPTFLLETLRGRGYRLMALGGDDAI